MVRKMLIAALLLVALAASPAAAQYETGVSPGQVQPGGVITISGTACEPNVPITITITEVASTKAVGDVLATLTVTPDGQGDFSITFTVPADTPPGTYAVSASAACVKGTTFDVVP